MSDIQTHLFVIFGASGDLARRKLLPALYRLMQSEEVARRCYVLGTARTDWTDEQFRENAREALRDKGYAEQEVSEWCTRNLYYQCLGEEGNDYEGLRRRIEQLERHRDLPGNRAFYLSLPPSIYRSAIEELGEVGLNASPGWTRLVVEKPFGYDLESARALNDHVHQYFSEDQVYRIDHYLGKETVQNLLAFRFGNAIFESIWSRNHIERVEITVSESLGVGGRGAYYDQSGQVRDMVQNHLTQLLTLTAMEPPTSMSATAIRQEKVKVLNAVQQPDPATDAVFGQYEAGTIDGESVPAYRDEPDIPDESITETFAALRLNVANWRWQGVPFYLRTGKRLSAKLTQIAVRFKGAPVSLFQESGQPCIPQNAGCEMRSNELLITLQPNEGFDLRFEVKAPGGSGKMELETQQLSFSYQDAFGPVPDAYETLLRDVILGDPTLFVRADEVEASWQLYAPLLEAESPVHAYEAGTWGPNEVERLLPQWTSTARTGPSAE
ncbi:glucose-6-phosphate dehydrogenase [Longimonas halophila]|uniref:Glucose-6-phosphate 1-dehydrogenase n=1 Tax=Longimonas halophila TaxID=1469170 RepID=A0A2H3NQF3_9BACT|nr:glucose-6-phosphate dehydrogenase [Longimonas halophila]PEN09312.1 glucose-6-phosphate dehydrogenase [Longimonas halophila]